MAVHENTSIPSAKQSRFSQITTRQFRISHHPAPSPNSLATAALGASLDSPCLERSATGSEGR